MRRAFPEEEARRSSLWEGLAWKDLLNNASLSERGVVFAMSTGLSRSSHPRAGWGYASYTTGTAPRCPLFLLLLCVRFVKLRTGGKNKKASSTSASGVLCREALRTSYKRRPFLRHPNFDRRRPQLKQNIRISLSHTHPRLGGEG